MNSLSAWFRKQPSSTQTRLIDFALLSALLTIVGLVARLRATAVLANGGLVAAACISAVCLVAAWVWTIRRLQPTSSASSESPTGKTSQYSLRTFQPLIIVGLLLTFTILVFYIPAREGFWDGYDEPGVLRTGQTAAYWWGIADQNSNRPFAYIGSTIAQGFSPDTIDGFFWLSVMIRLGTGVALYGILRQTLPGSKVIALIAALLFIVNPSDPGRFFVIALIGYPMSIFLLTMAIALYLFSFRHRIRWLLVVACMLLAMSLLSWETGYPVALLIPFLLWITIPKQRHWLAWAYAWFGMIAVLAARFIVYLLTTPNNYQLATAGVPVTSIGQLLQNLWTQLQPTFAFITVSADEQAYLAYGVLALMIAGLLIGIVSGRSGLSNARRSYLIGIGIAALAVFLGVVAYFKFPGTTRTQFFAAPAQAALWALLIGLIGSFLARRWQKVWLIAATGILVLISATGSMSFQADNNAQGISVNFPKLVYVYQQIQQIAPQFAPGTLILFVSNDFSEIPFHADYNIESLTQLILGTNAVETALDPLGWQPLFTPTGIRFEQSTSKKDYGYNEIVAFNLAPDGTVTLLKTIPQSLLPKGVSADAYNPTTRIVPAAITPLRFLRYSNWMTPYDPAQFAKPDIVAPSAQISLGDNWYPFETYGGQTFRWVNNDAEIIFNTRASEEKQLNLDLEAGARPDGQPLDLQVLDSEGHKVDEYTLLGHQTLSITFPASAAQSTYRLHVVNSVSPAGADPRTLNFRVFHIDAVIKPDIVDPSTPISLGNNWYPFETYGGQTFRWVNNDAEITFDTSASGERQLNLDLEAGARPDGQPLDLQVLDSEGHKIGEYTLTGHQTLSITFPASAAQSTYRLHVVNSVSPTAADPRTLNFRVFHIDAVIKPDILDPSAPISLGDNWYPFETYGGQTFRWVNNDAEITFNTATFAETQLNFDLEPGARPDGQPLDLQVLDSKGHTLDEYSISNHQTLSITFPASAAQTTYRLHVVNSVSPTAADPRTLNFRVFHITETTAP